MNTNEGIERFSIHRMYIIGNVMFTLNPVAVWKRSRPSCPPPNLSAHFRDIRY